GKELIARAVHNLSDRRERPLVKVNCAALPANLIESELFGHEKGAFTGAIARRIGKFEEANGGTLLLDEISEMHPSLQAKLLRAIQEREIDRVGGSKPVQVDIRLLATSNRNLEDEVNKGNFREDLYFRLNVVSVELPPLRDRPLDIEALAEHFVDKYSQANGMPIRALSNSARQRLHQHQWRGNVRELENAIHRAVLISSGDQIHGDSIIVPRNQDEPQHGSGQQLVGRSVADVERDLILGTLSHCVGNRTKAANILGISIRTLRNKLKQYTEEGCDIVEPKAS
ncbi:MAG: sigma-54 interaction domain-containing protein, partial [Alphaproteobacteria bacterium]